MNEKIRATIFELAEENYKIFSSKLLPGIDNILGVRIPNLRKLAKTIAIEDGKNYLNNCQGEYFEEIMLQGIVIGSLKNTTIEETLKYIEKFVPKINNWSVCDSFCSSLKVVSKNREKVWDFLQPYFLSEKEYEVRFALVILINFYVEKDYINLVIEKIDKVNHDGYYAKMAVAWLVSKCYVKFKGETLEYLNNNNLDDFTYNKSLQKICESLKVNKEDKALIKSMKRK